MYEGVVSIAWSLLVALSTARRQQPHLSVDVLALGSW